MRDGNGCKFPVTSLEPETYTRSLEEKELRACTRFFWKRGSVYREVLWMYIRMGEEVPSGSSVCTVHRNCQP